MGMLQPHSKTLQLSEGQTKSGLLVGKKLLKVRDISSYTCAAFMNRVIQSRWSFSSVKTFTAINIARGYVDARTAMCALCTSFNIAGLSELRPRSFFVAGKKLDETC